MTSGAQLRFALDLIPEWPFALPPAVSETDLGRSERFDRKMTGDCFARRQPNTLSALKIADCERMIFVDLPLDETSADPLASRR